MSKFDGLFDIGTKQLTIEQIAALPLSEAERKIMNDEVERQISSPVWSWQPQLIPPSRKKHKYRTWILRCGRGSGKSYALGDLMLALCDERFRLPERLGIPYIPKARILLISATFADALHTIVRPFVDRCGGIGGGIIKSVNYTSGTIEFVSGGEVRFIGADSPDRPRGMSVHCSIADEQASWASGEVWENAALATRLAMPNGDPGLLVVATTPKIKQWLKAIFEDPGAVTTSATPMQNVYLTKENIAAIVGLYKPGSLRYKLEILALPIYANDDALFDSADWIVDDVENFPKAEREIIVLDPALKIGKDDTGILVLGRRGDAIQVLDDYSSNTYGPNEVIEALRQAIEEHPNATDLLVESNAAESWLKKVLLGAELPIHIIYVRANKSKESRAEQAIIVSETGKLHVAKHVADGQFGEELMLWSPGAKGNKFSPGRIDCLAHGVNALTLGKASRQRKNSIKVAGIPDAPVEAPEGVLDPADTVGQFYALLRSGASTEASQGILDDDTDQDDDDDGYKPPSRRVNTKIVVAGTNALSSRPPLNTRGPRNLRQVRR